MCPDDVGRCFRDRESAVKKKIEPNSQEVVLGSGEMIVSKTDLTGRITYANRTFMRISNFAERDLLGVQHNIVRHPDMPRGVYRFMWETLKSGQEFFGLVKNMTADGAYYWVFANVTPDLDASGRAMGYFSVRRPPPADAVRAVVPLYEAMLRAEREAGAANAPDASMALLHKTIEDLNTTYDKFVLGLYKG
ncbi:MAG: aerotaxis receptor Aer [Azoarcus sp.]|nr:MAG: aerotaxis receptor Aer [Azoarcus sp.]TVT52170.1 MAG: PAS domain-containing protein [Azoarcus sp. PHD]